MVSLRINIVNAILRKVIAILTSDGKMICSVRKSDFFRTEKMIFPYGKVIFPYGKSDFSVRKSDFFRTEKWFFRTEKWFVRTEKYIFPYEHLHRRRSRCHNRRHGKTIMFLYVSYVNASVHAP